jgi:hypothetical protein
MKFSTFTPLVLLASIASTAVAIPAPSPIRERDSTVGDIEALQDQANDNILAQLEAEEAALAKRGVAATCTVRNIAIRRELSVHPPKSRS